MESTPYIQTDLPSNQSVLQQKLQTKLDYLTSIQSAVVAGDDRQIYELLDSQLKAMKSYLQYLMIRAEIEGIDL